MNGTEMDLIEKFTRSAINKELRQVGSLEVGDSFVCRRGGWYRIDRKEGDVSSVRGIGKTNMGLLTSFHRSTNVLPL